MGATSKRSICAIFGLGILMVGCGPKAAPPAGKPRATISAGSAPDPAFFSIRSVTPVVQPFGAPGCTADDISVTLSPDASAISVLYQNWNAEATYDGRVTRVEKYCDLDIDLDVPSGWSFALKRVDYRGAAVIDADNWAVLRSGYFFGRERGYLDQFIYGPFPTRETVAVTGLQDLYLRGSAAEPVNGSFELQATRYEGVPVAWSPCDTDAKTLKLRSQTVAQAQASGVSNIYVDSLDANFGSEYQLEWRQCEVGVTENMKLDASTAIWVNDRGEDVYFDWPYQPEVGQVKNVFDQLIAYTEHVLGAPDRIFQWDGFQVESSSTRAPSSIQGQFTPILLSQDLTPWFSGQIAMSAEDGYCTGGDAIAEIVIRDYDQEGQTISLGQYPVQCGQRADFFISLDAYRYHIVSPMVRLYSGGQPGDRVVFHDTRISTTDF